MLQRHRQRWNTALVELGDHALFLQINNANNHPENKIHLTKTRQTRFIRYIATQLMCSHLGCLGDDVITLRPRLYIGKFTANQWWNIFILVVASRMTMSLSIQQVTKCYIEIESVNHAMALAFNPTEHILEWCVRIALSATILKKPTVVYRSCYSGLWTS